MNNTNGFLKRLGFVLTATCIVVCAIGSYIWYTLDSNQVQTIEQVCQENLFYLLIIGFVILSVVGFGLESIYQKYIYPIQRISAETALIYSSNPDHRLAISGSNEISNLVGMINQCADIYQDQGKDVSDQIFSAKKETEKERNLLAAIMAELPYAVIICNRNGRILLFNSLAKKMFTSQSSPNRVEHFIGLGRSIFHFFDKARIAHAMDEIEERLNSHKSSLSSHFITPMYSNLLLSVEAMPVLGKSNRMTGFILNIQNISNQVKNHEAINSSLVSFQQAMTAGFEQTQVVLDTITHPSNKAAANFNPLKSAITQELAQLSENFKTTSASILDHNLTRLPLTRLPLNIFLFGLQKKAARENNIRINMTNQSRDRRILGDSYSLTAAFAFITVNLSQITGTKEFDMNVHVPNGRMIFDLTWEDSPASQAQVEKILAKKMKTLPTLGYVLKQNQADFKIIPQTEHTCSRIQILSQAELKSIPIKKKRGAILVGSRPEFYDFDLFKMDYSKEDIFNTDLRQITYSVFDTETTGLYPEDGDEILSIAAVRIVNNQIIRQDIFEELVDPKRDIPLESYKIHGINYDMVEGKPDIESILPLFKIYSYDTVFIGHNIAFDMKMLKVKEKQTQTTFPNPVLDTLLLSALLHPLSEHHDMEGIARKLGVNIIGRHTALGDAIATAEIFLKLIPILNSKGIFTLKNAIEASQQTYYARLKY